MNKMNDPIEDAVNGFRQGWKEAGDPEAKLQPWAKGVLYFCLAVVVAAGGLVLYSQFAQ
jgi:hypothetical protein